MATQAYYDWVRNGKPWKAAKPISDLTATLRGMGYTVYILGAEDESHLKNNYPEDHCPFSVTGWPGSNPYPRVLALDVMPSKGLADLARLSKAMIAAKDSGLPQAAFMKYMNWTDVDGSCYHTSWQPSHATRSSTDKGHIHLSARTDFVDSDCALGWNPLSGGSTAPVPTPTPQPSSRPAPGPAVAFPLPQGYYFGWNTGPYNSISGWYGERYNGRLATEWLQMWANQIGRRGWDVGKGRTWLGQFGNDGKYGSEYDALARAFQRNQGLTVDGEIGPQTWWAAYHNPVT